MVIISVEQRYKFTESQHNYRIGTEIVYESREALKEIGKFKDKNRKSRCFNCNIYGHMEKYY